MSTSSKNRINLGKKVYCRGPYYKISIIYDNNGTEVTLSYNITHSSSFYGWQTYNSTSHKPTTLEFDFTDLINNAKFNLNAYTKKIIFQQSNDNSTWLQMTMNALWCYKDTKYS